MICRHNLPVSTHFCPLRVALEAPRYRRSLTNQTVNVTESLRMECDVEGRPLPRLFWFKDSQPLHQMSGAWVHLHRWCRRLHNSSARPPTQPDLAATWTLSHTQHNSYSQSFTPGGLNFSRTRVFQWDNEDFTFDKKSRNRKRWSYLLRQLQALVDAFLCCPVSIMINGNLAIRSQHTQIQNHPPAHPHTRTIESNRTSDKNTPTHPHTHTHTHTHLKPCRPMDTSH